METSGKITHDDIVRMYAIFTNNRRTVIPLDEFLGREPTESEKNKMATGNKKCNTPITITFEQVAAG